MKSPFKNHSSSRLRKFLPLLLVAGLLGQSPARAWWDKEWTGRKEFTIDTTKEGGDIAGPVGGSVVLLRLHQGNFPFAMAGANGEDLRFVDGNDKTLLPFQIEKYDSLLNEAFVWVQVPDIKENGQTKFRVYFGNASGKGAAAPDAKTTYDADTALVYHFGEKGAPAVDSSTQGNTAEAAGTPSDGSMIGLGVRFLGSNPITVPASESLKWGRDDALTWSAWLKPASVDSDVVVFSRAEGDGSFVIGLSKGAPFVEVKDATGTTRSELGEAIPAGVWKHLSLIAGIGKITLYLDGQEYASIGAALPALNSPLLIGGDGSGNGFLGEMDELEISRIARLPGFLQLAAVSQSGSEKANKLLAPGADEGGRHESPILEHLSLFGEISKSLTFDGWAVIALCSIMAGIGWFVAIRKFLYLNKIKKGADAFLEQWEHVSSDLTQLDHTDEDNIKSLGGKASARAQKLMLQSPLFHIYHIGSNEIRHRLQNTKDGFKGLSARSIQAIRASLDAGLAREVQGLNGDLVFLTISIAGGPYLGLLGTVIGVMITFAVIAKTGEVEVNSIAPGIAGALLATVAGLLVAIPALFIYSYLAARIKACVGTMQTFIDEFISKIAEFYPETK